MSVMIEVVDLEKRFDTKLVVDDISFEVNKGEVLGFLGPNGAGKSTTMKMITGFLPPTDGHVKILGHDVITDPIWIKQKIGYLPEGAPAYGDMTVKGFLGFVSDVRGYSSKEKNLRINAAIERVHLEDVLNQSIETLSKGFKRRVGLAQAILHDPPILIMDEPTDGLDPNQKHEVRTLIKEMSTEKAIIVSTHILEEVNAVCSRAIIIARGKLVFDDSPEQLFARSESHNSVIFSVCGLDCASVARDLRQIDSVKDVVSQAAPDGVTKFRVFPKKDKSIVKDLGHLVMKNNWEIDQLTLEQGQLDEVFRKITLSGSQNDGSLS